MKASSVGFTRATRPMAGTAFATSVGGSDTELLPVGGADVKRAASRLFAG
jgi:hypothetical protein